MRYIKGYVWWKVTLIYVACISIGAGVSYVQIQADNKQPQVQKQSLASATASQSIADGGVPVRLIIPSANINLEVVKGTYDTENTVWTVAEKQANFATNTNQPNTRAGSTLIYGHDRPQVLQPIKSIPNGSEAIVQTDKGYVFFYRYNQSKSTIVKPQDTSIFATQSPTPELILLTCDGAWSENRYIAHFSLTRAGLQ